MRADDALASTGAAGSSRKRPRTASTTRASKDDAAQVSASVRDSSRLPPAQPEPVIPNPARISRTRG